MFVFNSEIYGLVDFIISRNTRLFSSGDTQLIL